MILLPKFKSKQGYVFTTDENYVKYLYVAIKSLVDMSSKDNDYDIVILHSCDDTSILQRIKDDLSSDNIHIRYSSIKKMITGIDFFVSGHITVATYFRLFIPEIFPTYEKILYMDCDIIVREDVANFMNIDLEDKMVGVIPILVSLYEDELKSEEWMLKYPEYRNYFCSGEMLMDIQKLRKFRFTEKCLAEVKRLGHNAYGHDNNIICAVLAKDDVRRVKRVHYSWLVPPCMIREDTSIKKFENRIPPHYTKDMEEDWWKHPKIIHYEESGINKPWNCDNDKFNPYAKYWWRVAETTPFIDDFKKHLAEYQVEEKYMDLITMEEVPTAELLK